MLTYPMHFFFHRGLSSEINDETNFRLDFLTHINSSPQNLKFTSGQNVFILSQNRIGEIIAIKKSHQDHKQSRFIVQYCNGEVETILGKDLVPTLDWAKNILLQAHDASMFWKKMEDKQSRKVFT